MCVSWTFKFPSTRQLCAQWVLGYLRPHSILGCLEALLTALITCFVWPVLCPQSVYRNTSEGCHEKKKKRKGELTLNKSELMVNSLEILNLKLHPFTLVTSWYHLKKKSYFLLFSSVVSNPEFCHTSLVWCHDYLPSYLTSLFHLVLTKKVNSLHLLFEF